MLHINSSTRYSLLGELSPNTKSSIFDLELTNYSGERAYLSLKFKQDNSKIHEFKIWTEPGTGIPPKLVEVKLNPVSKGSKIFVYWKVSNGKAVGACNGECTPGLSNNEKVEKLIGSLDTRRERRPNGFPGVFRM